MKKITILGLGTCACLALISCKKGSDSSSGDSASSAAAPSIGWDGGKQLETVLPKEVIEGSPKPKGVPNLAPETKEFPKFLVPEDAALLSKGKPVTSSDDFPIIGEVSLITDGDKETGEGYFVELMDGQQWVQIDLGQSQPLYAILVWHFHGQKRVYNDVIVQVSNDPKFESGVTTLFNNDYDDSSGMGAGRNRPYVETRFGKLINGQGTEARYVRLYSRGNSSNEMNHYCEIEVYGKGS